MLSLVRHPKFLTEKFTTKGDPDLVDAPIAEAYALKEGLMLTQHIGCNWLIVQSDCMDVVEIMGNGGFTANSAAAFYDECSAI
jgi:hypothetical protein